MTSGNAIVVRDLTRRFGRFTAVDRVSFDVERGEIFGFLGANGAGKSTTIRMLCGLLKPTSGTAVVGGVDVGRDPEAVKQRIGYMSQKFSLYDDLTVSENIDFFSGVYNVPEEKKGERKKWALGMAGLLDRKDAVTRTLPAGFKQRLALGCAILHEPRILFLDEPTSGVDPISRRNFWKLIYEMSSTGTTVFVTTHYLDEADYCDRLGLIYRGKIIAGGAPNELKRRYMTRDVLEVNADRPIEAMDMLGRNGIETAVFGSLLHAIVESAGTAAPEIRRLLAQAGLAVHGIEKIEPSLEDVFVTLIEAS
jgi:ABC-2 type transport system ATP-binding protein